LAQGFPETGKPPECDFAMTHENNGISRSRAVGLISLRERDASYRLK
jgi:hypothetical protein